MKKNEQFEDCVKRVAPETQAEVERNMALSKEFLKEWRNNAEIPAPIDAILWGMRKQKQIDDTEKQEWLNKAVRWLRQHAISVIKFGVGDIIRLKGSLAEYTITSISDSAYHGNGWKIDFDCEDDYELVEAADPTESLSVINIEAFRKAMEE